MEVDQSQMGINSGDGGLTNAYWGATEKLVISNGKTGVIWYTQNIYASGNRDFGKNGSDNITLKGADNGNLHY